MKQYRITRSDFVPEGEVPGVPDAYIDPVDLANIKQATGIGGNLLGRTERPIPPPPVAPEMGTPEWFRRQRLQARTGKK